MTIQAQRHILAALLVAAGVCTPLAAQDAAPAKKAEPAPKAKKLASAAQPRPKSNLKPVDINHATKEEISFMLKIDVAVAAKIVAGRPYLTKARLLTHNIVSPGVYNAIKDRVVANQIKPAAPSPAKPVK